MIFLAARFFLKNRVRGFVGPGVYLFYTGTTTRRFFFQRSQLHRFAGHHTAMLHQTKARAAEQHDEGHDNGEDSVWSVFNHKVVGRRFAGRLLAIETTSSLLNSS